LVSPSRKTAGPGSLRTLNPPVPVSVLVDQQHRPRSVTLRGKAVRIARVQEVWEVDLEWWRSQPVSRRYYRVTTEDQRDLTIFWDLAAGGWYRQQG